MSRFYLFAISSVCLLGLTGIVIGSIGLTNIPTSLTRDEMYSTGIACSPDHCAQMLAEKQRASEGIRFSIVGASLFVCSLVCTIAGFLYINCCSYRPWHRVQPTELETSSGQTVPQLTHYPSTTDALQPTSVASGPQESPLP